MKKFLSLALVLAMMLALAIPAFAVDDPTWSVDYDKNAKAVVVTVNGETQKFTNWKNNQADEYTVNGWIVSVTVKGNAIDKKALVGPVAPVPNVITDAISTPSNSQIIVDAETRIWQDGFGFHCNNLGGNGATAVNWNGKTYEKGVQKDVFGTKTNPINLERVGTTTLWNLKTEDIVCATCGSKEWVTYSNNSGVINGKNIQVHHRAYAKITKGWADGNPGELEAIFDIYKYDSKTDDGRGVLVIEGILPDVEYQLEPGTYVVAEREKPGYEIQPDQRITVEEGKTTPVHFVNTPITVEDFSSLTIQKTVDGVPFGEWAYENKLTQEQFEAIIGGMKFTAYLLDGENGSRVGGKEYPGSMDYTGKIEFGEKLTIGWYEVEEEISGTATTYFVGEGNTQGYYVGKDGVSHETTTWISGKEGVGTIISADKGNRNWKLPDVWDGQLGNNDDFKELKAMGAQWIWDTEDTYKYGITGSEVRFDFEVDLAAELTAPIIFAADNAAIIYVDDKLAAYTEVAFAGRSIPQEITDEDDADTYFGNLDFGNFDGRWTEGWAHVYKKDITIPAGKHTITIFAANSARTEDSGTDNDSYDCTNNPCGLIFGFEIPGATFDNSAIEDYAEVSFTKTVAVDEEIDLTQFAFELFQYNEETNEYDIPVPYVELDSDENPIFGDGYYYPGLMGIVTAGHLDVGKYVFKEVDVSVWAPRGYEDGLFFEVKRGTGGLEVIWNIAEGEDVDDEENPIVVNELIVGSLEVTATVTAQHVEITYEPVYEDLWKENTTGTLVSKSNHTLGTLNGHQVFVAVNIADASNDAGFMVEVADSSPNNIGIGYEYNVKIVDGNIVVTFPDVKKADVGIMAANTTSGLKNGHPNGKDGTAQGNLTRENNTLSVALPADCDEFAYLFVHIAGGIQWYTGEKEVVGYEEVSRRTVTDTYAGMLTATLKDAEGEVVDSKTIANNGSVTFENLLPGEYTCILSGEGFADMTKTVTIVAGETATATFTASVTNDDVEIGKTPAIGTIIPKPVSFAPRGASLPVEISYYYFDVTLEATDETTDETNDADVAIGDEFATDDTAEDIYDAE